jgi:tRNA dimethylallyltransferase
VFEFQENFIKAFEHIRKREKQAIMCGGTGLYLEAALGKYRLLKVPLNKKLRKQLNENTQEELVERLSSLKTLHNTTDITDRNRLVRAIEIEEFNREHQDEMKDFPEFSYIIFGVSFPRKVIRERITARLKHRLENGMLKEVEQLLKSGLKSEQLTFYGLEYRYLT